MLLTKEQILEILLQGKPVSIVRAGDGESIMLNALSSVQAMQKASHFVLRRQLGYDPSIKDVEAIRQNLIYCYNNANIIGVPNHRQDTTSDWHKVTAHLQQNAPGYLNAHLCDIDVGYHMLHDNSYYQLLAGRPVLNYISCRDLDEGFKSKFNIGVVNKYTVAPESKFTSGYTGELHYPTQFNKAQRWMDVVSKDWPGSLLLVGAGVIGKIYCNWWRDRGGVAFDIGGVMDIFAGRITRGPEKGLDVMDVDSKFKL